MPILVKFTNTTNCPEQGFLIPDATPKNDGVMTKEQAAKLAGLTPGGGGGALAAGVEDFHTGNPLVVAVVFAAPLADANYVPNIDPGFSGASGGVTQVWPSDLAMSGFNINLQGDPGNDMQLFWTVNKRTQ